MTEEYIASIVFIDLIGYPLRIKGATFSFKVVAQYPNYQAFKRSEEMSCSIITTWPKVHTSEYRFTDASTEIE